MTDSQVERREALKRFYLDSGHSNLDFMKDVMEYRRIHGVGDVGLAIDGLWAEHEALGNVKAPTSD